VIAAIGGLAFALILLLVVTPKVFSWLYQPRLSKDGTALAVK